MLDKQSKVVLDKLIELVNENNLITETDKIYEHISKYTKKQIDDSIEYLKECDLINVRFADGRPLFISINYEGLHYRNFERLHLRSFLMKSIITPIIVSIITTLFALWINAFITK